MQDQIFYNLGRKYSADMKTIEIIDPHTNNVLCKQELAAHAPENVQHSVARMLIRKVGRGYSNVTVKIGEKYVSGMQLISSYASQG